MVIELRHFQKDGLFTQNSCLEAGLADNPLDELGILQSELFRAVRLVVDTGMHYKRWTREKAMAYMKAKTGMSDTEVRVEIERYIVWPAQALSYKVGMIKILELRKRAKMPWAKSSILKTFTLLSWITAVLLFSLSKRK